VPVFALLIGDNSSKIAKGWGVKQAVIAVAATLFFMLLFLGGC
jgi:hypothetical protein